MKFHHLVFICVTLVMLVVGVMSLPADALPRANAHGAMDSPLPPPSGNTCVARAVVNIRNGPAARNRIVGRIPRNGSFVVTSASGRWLQGTSQWGSGWVMAVQMRCAR